MIDENRFATSAQFNKLLLRMMPSEFSSIGEGRLIAAIISQSWSDANKSSARTFFTSTTSRLDFLCLQIGLEPTQIRELFKKHNKHYADFVDGVYA